MIKKILFILSLILIQFIPIKNTNVFAQNKNFSSKTSEIVMELNTKRVLFENNIYEKKYMASTTKILTAIVIIENCNLDKKIKIDKKTTNVEGSSIYLEEGEILSIKDLLYGLMLRSGNDCAKTLAVHCSGSIEAFSNLMNTTAKKIGANDSNFVNPHGLHDDNHYTTAYDLALISCYAMRNKIFRELVNTKSIKIPFTTKNTCRLLINKNKMLKEFEGSNGIKTGFTKKAGRCLVSSCSRNGLELISVVLNSPPMFERSKELLSNSFNEYKTYKIIESDHIIDFVNLGNKRIPIHIKNDIVLPLTAQEYGKIKIEYDYPTSIQEKNEKEIGLIKIFCENNLLFTEKIYTII